MILDRTQVFLLNLNLFDAKKNIEQLNSISNDEANNLALSLVPKIREIRSKTDNTNTNISDDILNLIHKENYLGMSNQSNGVD